MKIPDEPVKVIKEPTEVVIYLQDARIEGTVYLPIGSRLSDFINDKDIQFIPITDAKVIPLKEKEKSYNVDFMDLNKNYIISIIPRNSI